MDDDPWDDEAKPPRPRTQRERESAAIETTRKAIGAVLVAPFVVGWGMLQAAFVGAVWLFGLAAIAAVVGVVYVIVR